MSEDARQIAELLPRLTDAQLRDLLQLVRGLSLGPQYSRGEDRPMSKLTDEDVRELRELRRRGWSYADLARHHGVAHATARKAALGLTWGHVG